MNSPNTSLQSKTAAEQVKLLYRHGCTALPGSLASVGFASYLLKAYAPNSPWWLWCSGTLAVYLVRLLFMARFERLAAGGAVLDWGRWKAGYLLGACVSGFTWGLITLVLPNVLAIETGIALLIGGMSASATIVYSAVRGGCEAFMLPAMVMITAYLAGKDGEIYSVMTLMMLVHILVLLAAAKRTHIAVLDNVRYALEKDELSESLRQSLQNTAQLNQSLQYEMAQRAQDAEKIRRSEEELRTIMDNMQDVFFREDMDGALIRLSPSVADLLGYRPEELLGSQTVELYHDPAVRKHLGAELKSGGGSVFGYRKALRHKNGDTVWVSTNAHYCRDPDGNIVGVEGTARDVTENKRLEDEMWRIANFDSLTGLPNRRLFYDRLSVAMARAARHGKRGALMFVDLDGFKSINDDFGHAAGDAYLCETARRLEALLRKSDTVARIGGDEFTIILAEVSSVEHVAGVIDKIQASLASPMDIGGQQRPIAASLGATVFPDEGDTVDELLRTADYKMYAAKAQTAVVRRR